MLPKSKRIPRKAFSSVLKGGKMFKNSLFVLKIAFVTDKQSRFCFSVSKKVAKNAVQRNKMRRLGYNIIGGYIKNIKSGVFAVFSFRNIPKNKTEVVERLESILNESGLTK